MQPARRRMSSLRRLKTGPLQWRDLGGGGASPLGAETEVNGGKAEERRKEGMQIRCGNLNRGRRRLSERG